MSDEEIAKMRDELINEHMDEDPWHHGVSHRYTAKRFFDAAVEKLYRPAMARITALEAANKELVGAIEIRTKEVLDEVLIQARKVYEEDMESNPSDLIYTEQAINAAREALAKHRRSGE